MLIVLECVNCNQNMGIKSSHVTPSGDVKQRFVCPYCEYEYNTSFHFTVKKLQGGVNISGSVNVGGDVVGGDQVNYRK